MNVAFALSVDPSIGRIDKHSLSSQTLMEILVDGITNKENVCGDAENPKDIAEWEGLRFSDFNELEIIDWFHKKLEGNVSLEWLPFSIVCFSVQWNELTGSVNLTCLPDGLQLIALNYNLFEGTVDLAHLPLTLESLHISQNSFFGSIDFGLLPKSLKHIDVSYTELEGDITDFAGKVNVHKSNVKDLRQT